MKKIIVIGTIFLFIGSISSSTGFTIEKKSVSSLDGDIFYVDDDFNESTPGWGVTHFARIHDALKVVSDGDTMFVYSGIYTGSFKIYKSINLIGEDKNTTYITSYVSSESDWVNVSGFTINRPGSDEAIRIDGNYNTIENNIILGEEGILIISRYNKISENIIITNDTAIFIAGGIEDYNTIIGNIIKGTSGEGISSDYSYYNNISHNFISGFSIGVYIAHGKKNTIAHNILSSNECGISFLFGGNNKIIGNHIVDNTYGISISGIGYLIQNNNFINNSGGNADFSWSARNKWNGNYWDKPRDFPYPIFGSIGIIPSILVLILSFSPGILIVPYIVFTALLYLSLVFCAIVPTWITFDWHPAQEPYDIGG